MVKEIEAFILTGSSFESDNKQIIKLYGQSTEGAFSVTIDNFQNYFFCEAREHFDFQALNYKKAIKIVANTQSQLNAKVKEFEAKGLQTFETDIRPLDRFLMDSEFYAQIKITGAAKFENGLLNFYNPRLEKSSYYPDVKIFSFDIETGRDGKLLSLAYNYRYKAERQEAAMVLGEGKDTNNVFFARTEKDILLFFEKAIATLDPDIITGWNVIGFDLKFLANKSKELKTPLYIARNKRALDLYQNLRGEWQVNLEGRVIVDGPRALKMNFINFESYKLNYVAKALLGSGKDIDEDEVHDKWDEIERRFREDKMALAKYNISDASLVLDIYEKTKIIDLLLNRSLISGMLMERVGGSTAAFDHFYLPALHKKGVVALNTHDIDWSKQAKGGFVIDPEVGKHSNVLLLDFKSLYPTIIQTFGIDPLSRFSRQEETKKTPVGIEFSKTEHILPGKITELLGLRKKAKDEKNEYLSQAVKILMNSFYGVMGSNGCRFYHEDLPDAITGTGQWILKTVKHFLNKKGLNVLYGDTDSIFVQLKTGDNYRDQAFGLIKEINSFLEKTFKENYDVESKLEIQFDKFFKTLLLTSARGTEEGAKKRYAGLAVSEKNGKEGKDERDELIFRGMEYVRSDWSMLARNFQYELSRRIFYNEDLGSFINETVQKLEAKELDDQLILSKRLSKPVEEYIKNVPPHARAAKILYEKTGRTTRKPEYVMTFRGPIPVELPHDDIDYDYYIEKQLAPVANSLLSLLGETFDNLRGGQLSLF